MRTGAVAVAASGIGVITLIVASLMFFDRGDRAADGGGPIVASVNGEAITAKELSGRMALRRHEAAAGAADPATLKRSALDDVARIKLQQLLARSEGIDVPIAYSDFRRAFAAENERRRKAAADGEVLYGPQQYTEQAYFEYVLANMVAQLKQRLAGNAIPLSEAILRDHYEDLKEMRYRQEGETRVYKIRIGFLDGEGKSSAAKKQDAEARIQEAQSRLSQGDAFAELAAEYNETEAERANLGLQTFDASTARKDRLTDPLIRSEAMKLEPGGVSGIVETGSAYYLLQVIDRKPANYRPFDEAREDVRMRYVELRYAELVDRLVREAELDIVQDAYDAVGTP